MPNFTLNSQKAALVKALLDGKTLSVMNCFSMLGITNCAREIGRSIVNSETGFGASVIKKQVDIKTQYGTTGYYFTYQLERSEANKEAIQKMKEYLAVSDVKPIVNDNGIKPKYIEQTLF